MPGRPPAMGGRPPGVGALRVGCIGRRSPGRNGGREPGAIGAPDAPGAPGAPDALAGPDDCPGRGRWKIGCPRTGNPVRLPMGDDGWAGRGGAGGGAVYTGRGPVCGTIMRRGGGWPGRGGRAAEDDAGLWAAVVDAAGSAGAALGGSAAPAGTSTTGACATGTSAAGASTTAVALTGAWTVSEADEETAAGTSAAACSADAAGSVIAGAGSAATGDAGGTTGAVGRGAKLWRCWTDSGVTMRGATTGGAAATGGRGATGLLTIALGGAGGGGTWAAVSSGCSLRARMAFSASPGLEILERSILGRNSSPPPPPPR